MGGLLQGTPWRARQKPTAQARRTSSEAEPAGDPPAPSDEGLRGLCVSDSVCGMFAEIKPPPPRA